MSQSGFPQQWARHIDAVWGNNKPRRGSEPSTPPGPPAWMAGLFGLGQPEAPRGPRVRRGDVRSAILDVLRRAGERDEQVNGYQVIQKIADLSGEEWRPSPGSVYPTISQLEDEGLIRTDEAQGRKSLTLTDEGRTWVAEHTAVLDAVWEPFQTTEAGSPTGPGAPSGASARADLKPEIGQVMSAVWQILTNGSSSQRAGAVDVLVDTRRKLYGILADGEPAEPTVDGQAEAPIDAADPEATDGQGEARWSGGSW